jgi:PAS domain S-box-containing protein
MMGKILVIDDEEGIRFTFQSFLSKEGHEVVTAEDYDAALKALSLNEFDLIFADIILGKYTGIDILREIKNRNLRCPVIMITGQPDIETAAQSVRLGAFDYVAKPVVKEALLRLTNLALGHKALADEKEKYRRNLEAIFRSVTDAIVTVDNEMRVIEANDATRSICGIDPKEISGKKIGDCLSWCNKSCIKVLMDTLKGNKTIKEYRVECGQQNRPRQVVVLSSSPLVDSDNRSLGAVLVIRDITRLNALEQELKERYQFHNIIGKSGKMQGVYRLLENLADSETTVLIDGESGTGKELAAEALHYSGVRTSKPLVKVNCSALAENLLESELFGHVKGAFTGAIKDKEGRFEAANHGTIFLDEIGDLSPGLQVKFLRVLQEKEFERVGDITPIKVDVRVIAATNQDLREKVRRGEFREDLYYRLKVVKVSLPPLRERPEDIPLLVDHFCKSYNKKLKKNIRGVSDQVLRTFMYYPWPGNVRELMHAIEHAYILGQDPAITVDDLPSEIRDYSKSKIPVPKDKSTLQPDDIIQALEKTDWNKAKASRLLGVSRQTLYRKIEDYKIVKPAQ